MILGLIFAALAVWLVMQSARQWSAGFVSLEFWWTYPKLKAYRLHDGAAFWLLALAKLLLIIASAVLAVNLVRTA